MLYIDNYVVNINFFPPLNNDFQTFHSYTLIPQRLVTFIIASVTSFYNLEMCNLYQEWKSLSLFSPLLVV